MKKEEKDGVIDALVEKMTATKNFYLTDISELTVEKTNNLRRTCYKKNIELKMVKNTLLRKAFERMETDYSPLFDVLKGSTSVMFTDTVNEPMLTLCIHDALEPTIATGWPSAVTVKEVPNIIVGSICGASP